MLNISDPNCTMGLRQNMTCNYISPKISQSSALQECTRLEMYSHKEHAIGLPDINWSKLTNESLVWIGQREEGSIVQEDNYCRAWSLRKLRYQSVPCDTELPTFCQSDLIGRSLDFNSVFNFSPIPKEKIALIFLLIIRYLFMLR